MHQILKHMRGFSAALCILILCLPAAHAQIVYREVVATGNGGDPSAAMIDAIENAIGQVGGMKMSSATSMSMSEVTRGNSTTLEQDFKQNIERLTRGVVKSYSVLESGTSPGSGRSFVKIKAVIPTYKASEQLKRLKLAVMPLTVVGSASSKPDAANFAESVSAALEAYLTQTRKFAMIDRRYSDSSNRELARVNSRNAPIEETVKVGMRVGADYIVLAALKEFAAQQVQQQRVTGRVVSRLSAPVSIDVRVLDIATGQIKFAQTYVNPGRLHSNMSLSQYAADIGSDIGQVINMAIYPIAVVSANAGQVTLNQGGDTVQVGRVYRLVSLGQNLIDPYTKESLGQEEKEVARVEVTSVTDRTATAKVVTGSLPATVKPGSVLARVLPDDPNMALNVQVSLPTLPGTGNSVGAGKSKSKDDEDW
ncbi:MAG: CsgG/HfaB family protein [Limnohabitans sp.]|uniref:CsgG/HfaB family protein n=2 Tax=Limnohabitans sp. TaxID=1907725 RepID=UPI003C74FDB7